jgi:TPR repeat protein
MVLLYHDNPVRQPQQSRLSLPVAFILPARKNIIGLLLLLLLLPISWISIIMKSMTCTADDDIEVAVDDDVVVVDHPYNRHHHHDSIGDQMCYISSSKKLEFWNHPTGHEKSQQHTPPKHTELQPQQPPMLPHHRKKLPLPGQLRPSDIPPPEIFDNFLHNSTMQLPGKIEPQEIRCGTVQQINPIRQHNNSHIPTTNVPPPTITTTTEITYLPQIVDSLSVQKILKLLRAHPWFDEDPDTVDGMTTHEIFVDSPEIRQVHHQQQQQHAQHFDRSTNHMKGRDYDPITLLERTRLREQLQTILQPILQERITPLVRRQYRHVCQQQDTMVFSTMNGGGTKNHTEDDRSCTPCFSLIRRYRTGERQSHGTHYDGHAFVTVVVSLSNYGSDYHGGLYVSTGYGQRQFVPLYLGDAVAHQSNLLHGVQVFDVPYDNNNNHHQNSTTTTTTERWSWILWYRDSIECTDYSYQWFANCAQQGDAICQELYATKVGSIPSSVQHVKNDHHDVMSLVVYWNRAAAEQGNGNAAVKMARAYLKLLPSTLSYNATEAIRYYRIAIAAQHPDGYYGMAHLCLLTLQRQQLEEKSNTLSPQQSRRYVDKALSRVVRFLEAAAIRGHTYAMFNLGIVHCYGYGIPYYHTDTELASLWFVQSGLPEGYYAAAYQAAVVGNVARQRQYNDHARALGYYQPWRKEARQRTGSGGAGGIDLNMMWPISHDGRKPPIF